MNGAELDALGMSPRDAYDQAARNLRATGAAFEEVEPLDRAHQLAGAGHRTAGWLAFPDVLETRRDAVAGDLLVMAPALADLFVIGTEAGDLDTALGYTAMSYETAPDRLSPVPYLVRDGRLEPWLPDERSPHHEQVRASRLLQLQSVYEPFGQQLDDELRDTFVARPIIGNATEYGPPMHEIQGLAAGTSAAIVAGIAAHGTVLEPGDPHARSRCRARAAASHPRRTDARGHPRRCPGRS